MQLDLFSILFAFGSLQALVLLVGINLHKPLFSDLKKATSWLLLDIILMTAYYLLLKQGVRHFLISILGNIAWMSIAPLYYLLIKALRKSDWTLSIKDLLILIIPTLFLLEAVFAVFRINIWSIFGVRDAQSYLDLWMLIFFVSSIYFLILSARLISKGSEEDQNTSIRWFTWIFLATLVTYGLTYCFIRTSYVIVFEQSMMCLLTLFIFLLIYRVFKVLSFQKFFDQKKYQNLAGQKSHLTSLAERLEKVMKEEKPYLNSDLTLGILSEITAISNVELSRLFNLYYRSSYYEFVNRYRVDHIEKLILDKSNSHFKISALAEKSGFKSKATFYKAFREKHQLTPVEFMKKHRT